MGQMDDKRCIVTGGAGEIGLASARLLQSEGARVMLVDRRQADLDAALSQMDPDRTLTAVADVTSSADCRAFIASAVDAWGAIDVLFANAGVSGTSASTADYPEDVFAHVIDVNVMGVFLTCKHAIPDMADGGSIIVMSSIMGVTARPNSVAYITSKHAVVGMTRAISKELAPRNIRANVLAPGPTSTAFQQEIEDRASKLLGIDMTEMLNKTIPLGRHATADEIAKSVLYLASDMSSFSTGGVFMADGGWHA